MATTALAFQRLSQQRLTQSSFRRPGEVVAWLGAVQAQDYPAAKWAIGLRTQGVSAAGVDEALARGEILRTHVLRPTWHFVAPQDIRWMLALTAPRVQTAVASSYRRLEINRELMAQVVPALVRALEGGKQLTRAELIAQINRAGIVTGPPLRALHMLLYAELEGILCSGGRRGKHATYALLEEWVPPARSLTREESLAELTQRYFTSHGPATLKDFAWWSGLTVADSKAGLELVKETLVQETVGERAYWLSPDTASTVDPGVYLLPNFDEYTVAYSDRSAIFDPVYAERLGLRESVVMNHAMVAQGQVVGTWKRTLTKKGVQVALSPFEPLIEEQAEEFSAAACRFASFWGMSLEPDL